MTRPGPWSRLFGRATPDDPMPERGSASVEFAIIAPVVVAFLLSIVELGNQLSLRNALQFAADETARYALVNAKATGPQLQDIFRNRFATLRKETAAVDVRFETADGMTFVVITGSYGSPTLTGRSRVPLPQ